MKQLVLQGQHWQEDSSSGQNQRLRWIQVERDEPDWESSLRQLIDFPVHEAHIRDSLNREHPPKYEGSADYDLLILPSPVFHNIDLSEVHQYTLIFNQQCLISISPAGGIDESLQQRILNRRGRTAECITDLIYGFANAMIADQLDCRGLMTRQLEALQKKLLGSRGQKVNWEDFFSLQQQLNTLISLAEMQQDSVTDWLAETSLTLSQHNQIRFNDVREHLHRFSIHLEALNQDCSNVLQIYFSLSQERTNNTIRLLTVISVIFLPLNLLAGIFGMNFSQIPLLHDALGFWVVLGIMVLTAVAVYRLLRRIG